MGRLLEIGTAVAIGLAPEVAHGDCAMNAQVNVAAHGVSTDANAKPCGDSEPKRKGAPKAALKQANKAAAPQRQAPPRRVEAATAATAEPPKAQAGAPGAIAAPPAAPPPAAAPPATPPPAADASPQPLEEQAYSVREQPQQERERSRRGIVLSLSAQTRIPFGGDSRSANNLPSGEARLTGPVSDLFRAGVAVRIAEIIERVIDDERTQREIEAGTQALFGTFALSPSLNLSGGGRLEPFAGVGIGAAHADTVDTEPGRFVPGEWDVGLMGELGFELGTQRVRFRIALDAVTADSDPNQTLGVGAGLS